MNYINSDCLKFLCLCSNKGSRFLCEMLHRLKLRILLNGLTLLLFGRACNASALGLAVYAVPQDSDGGTTVSIKKLFSL